MVRKKVSIIPTPDATNDFPESPYSLLGSHGGNSPKLTTKRHLNNDLNIKVYLAK